MPMVEIQMSPADIEAAKRIALKMYPHVPRNDDAQTVIHVAAILGLDRMRVIWLDAEDQANAYADAKIRADKIARNEGKPEHDLNTYGGKMKEGT